MKSPRSIQRQRRSVAATAFVLALTFVVNGPAPGVGATTAAGGIRQWVARYRGPDHSGDTGWAVAVSPDGARVYMAGTGIYPGQGQNGHYTTVAFDAATGATVWNARYDGPGKGYDEARALAVSPDGTRVYVTGRSTGDQSDYATVAYNAVTGVQVWVRRYDSPGIASSDEGVALSVGPDSATVYVTGAAQGSAGDDDYVTFAYDASTGATIWMRRYQGPGRGQDVPFNLGVSPDGTKVYVTGQSYSGAETGDDYATLAYGAATGAKLWVARYNGPANDYDFAYDAVVSADGAFVYVTGRSLGSGTKDDFATVAYDAVSGVQVWAVRYNGPTNDYNQALAVGVSPDGAMVYVLGQSFDTGPDPEMAYDYVTVAYDAATGAQVWLRQYNGAATSDQAFALAVSPDGARVYVTGQTANTLQSGLRTDGDYGTVAYDAATGAQVWARRYTGPRTAPGDYGDIAYDVAVSPDSTKVYVTGGSEGRFGPGLHPANNATIAYSAG